MRKEIQNFILQSRGIAVESRTVFSFPIHSHSYYEMTLYMPFRGNIRINGNKYTPDAPFISFIAPTDYHVIEVEEENPNARYIKLSFLSEILDDSLREEISRVVENVAEGDILFHLFDEIYNRGNCKYSYCLLNAIVCELITRGEKVTSNQVSSSFSMLMRAVSKINSDYRENLTLSSVAREIGITPQYLSRLFCKNAGVGFVAYLNRIRLEKAAFYLKETDLAVTDIAYEVGFRDLSHFMRSFKRHFDTSPLVYRNNR